MKISCARTQNFICDISSQSVLDNKIISYVYKYSVNFPRQNWAAVYRQK